MRKAELLDTLRAERRWLDNLLARLDEAAMLEPGVEGEWTVKDLVAHLAAWERRGTRWIEAMAQGHSPPAPEPGLTWRDVAYLNTVTYEESQWRALGDVLADFQAAFPPLVAAIEALPEDYLACVYDGPETDHEPRYGWEIVAWRFRHYQAHGQALAAYVKKKFGGNGARR